MLWLLIFQVLRFPLRVIESKTNSIAPLNIKGRHFVIDGLMDRNITCNGDEDCTGQFKGVHFDGKSDSNKLS